MPRADGGDDAADLFVGQDLVVAGLVGVDDFAAQGEDGLVLADAAALGAAAGGIALDEVQFAAFNVAAGAIAEFAGQSAAAQRAFAFADQHAGLARALAGLGGQLPLLGDDAGRLRVLLQVAGQVVAHRRVDDPLDLAVAQLGLRLALELRLGHAKRDDRGESLAAIVAGGHQVLVNARLLAVGVDGPRDGGAEAGQVRAAFARVDVVHVGVDVLGVLRGVLQGDFQPHALDFAVDVDDVFVGGLAGAVEQLDELEDASLVVEALAGAAAHVLDRRSSRRG